MKKSLLISLYLMHGETGFCDKPEYNFLFRHSGPLVSKDVAGDNALDNICSKEHNISMSWEVTFYPAFEQEFDTLPFDVQDELLAQAKVLETFGRLSVVHGWIH